MAGTGMDFVARTKNTPYGNDSTMHEGMKQKEGVHERFLRVMSDDGDSTGFGCFEQDSTRRYPHRGVLPFSKARSELGGEYRLEDHCRSRR